MMGKRKVFSMKGQSETEWGEPKEPMSLGMTATGRKRLDELAALNRISRSELIERLVRGTMTVASVSPQEQEPEPKPTVEELMSSIRDYFEREQIIELGKYCFELLSRRQND